MRRRGQGLKAMAASRRCAHWRMPFMSSSCRASERDPIALVESCQRSLLWLLQSHQREPLRRCWIDHPYGEEEITLLEEELMPVLSKLLRRIEEIDTALETQQQAQLPSATQAEEPVLLR